MRNFPGHPVEEEMVTPGDTDDTVLIRQAQLSDIPAMLAVINDYASKAVMLPRTELEICESLRDFLVAIDVAHDASNDPAAASGPLVGCAALHFYTQHMAELRSLAVAPSRSRSGLGRRLTEEILREARQIGVDMVFAFTYVPGFFEKMGFETVDRGALPLKAWKDCVRCPKFQACDEIAMAYKVTPGAEIYMSAAPPEEAYDDAVPLFPILGTPRILDKI